jgi:hypothetical protein
MLAGSGGHHGRVLLLALLLAAGPVRADLPEPLLDDALENVRMCKEAGGTPRFQGVAIPGAEQSDEVFIPYVTEADLNGDGAADYVTDLAGLDCVDAWTLFCGSAGCPVTVWLSRPEGLSVAWGGHAQAWELKGAEVVLYLHGQMCTPPRAGVEGCEEVLRFDRAAAPAAAAAPVPPGALASSPRPRPRPGGVASAEAAAAPPPAEGSQPETKGTDAEAAAPATPTPLPPDTAAPESPVLPTATDEAAPGWTSARLPDDTGWYARVEDPESGARIDWICAKGRESRLALTPAPEGDTITIDVDGRTQEFAVTAEDGTAYAPVAIGSPLFLHIASGQGFRILDAAGAPVARFSMRDAPLAIGEAEGRCQF